MENYQLYRTNVLLSGQMKWDLILNSLSSNRMSISDFHLTPISDNISFNRYSDDDSLLKYSHKDNIKQFYNEISGSFYKEYINPKLKGDWPIISDDKSYQPLHDDTFMMGCKRDKYSLYHKQFTILCPLWLEQLNQPLKFEFILYKFNKNGTMSQFLKRYLIFDKNNSEYHNKFIDYFNQYIKYLKLDEGNDDIMLIDFDKKIAKIKGFDVINGKTSTKDIPLLIQNLTYRERPLLEFDSLIIDEFRKNHLIANQLFNFCFHLNLDDLIHPLLQEGIMGSNICLKVFAYVGNQKLELQDFYSNYEYIPKKYCGALNDDFIKENIPNVLNYLDDTKCIDFINKNKISQSIIHWSLIDNNDYLLNLYNGFAGYTHYKDNDKKNHVVYSSHFYNNTPDLRLHNYLPEANNIGWCNHIILNKDNAGNFNAEFSNYTKYLTSFNNYWVNDIRYPIKKDIKILLVKLDDTLKDWSPLGFSYTHEVPSTENFWYRYINNDNKLFSNVLFLIARDFDKFTFDYIHNVLNRMNYDELNDAKSTFVKLSEMVNSINSFNNPPIIKLNNTLRTFKTIGPNSNVKEIEYYKYDQQGNYVFRYSGKIRPTFSIGKNKLYYKDITYNYMDSIYSKYSNTGFAPLYPSINYYATKSIDLKDYENIPTIEIEHENKPLINDYEYKWFNCGKHFLLKPEIKFSMESTYMPDGLNKTIEDYLSNVYNIKDEKTIKYIKNQYNINNDFEYADKKDISKYIYNIKLILK